MSTSNEFQLLASVAVFRELYNSNKDLYSVIADFIEHILVSKKQFCFSLTEVTYSLNKEFNFNIPDSVVKAALKRLKYISKDHGKYYVQSYPEAKSAIKHKTDLNNKMTDDLLEKLLLFAKKNKPHNIKDYEKYKIRQAFFSFLLDESIETEYSKIISSFIISLSKDETLEKKIKKLREGVILYSGLKYTDNIHDLGTWKKDLVFFLDTEMIFHFAGYNGEVYKSLFVDFFNFVKEINIKAKKTIIFLKYFEETKKEIERFFNVATEILEGNTISDPSMTAMNSILNGCSDKTAIIEKKADLFTLLDTNNIILEEREDSFFNENREYNIISQEMIETISQEIGFDITDNLTFLNYINLKRNKKVFANFEDIKFILLTGNKLTLKVAWHNLIKQNGQVPLATSLHWITNRFWFTLNKGFGNNELPKSFDATIKAQLILSSSLSDMVHSNYKDLSEQFKSKKLTKEQAAGRLIVLKQQALKPEEINKTNIDSIAVTLSNKDLEDYNEENGILRKQISEANEQIVNLEKQKKESDDQHNKEILDEKLRRLNYMEDNLQTIKKKANRTFLLVKYIIITLYLFFHIFIAFYIYYWGKPVYLYIIESIPSIATGSYLIIKEKTINPKVLFQNIKSRILTTKKKKHNFDYEEYEKLKAGIRYIQNMISDIDI